MRANTEGPSPAPSGPNSPGDPDSPDHEIDAPVVTGTGGPATSATGHTTTLKKHKARGKKSKPPVAGSSTPAPTPGPSTAQERTSSPARSGSRRPQSKGPKKDSTPPQDVEAEKTRLRGVPFKGALTAKMIEQIITKNGPLTGSQIYNHLRPFFDNPELNQDQVRENQTRMKGICNMFFNKRKQAVTTEKGEGVQNVFSVRNGERYE